MLTWMQATIDLLWRNALVLVPMAAVVLILCRCIPNRPATRHSLWLCLVVWLVAGTILPPLRFSSHQTTAEQDASAEAPAASVDGTRFLEAAAVVDHGIVSESPPPTLCMVDQPAPTAAEVELTCAAIQPQSFDTTCGGTGDEPRGYVVSPFPHRKTPTPPRTVAPVASDSPLISLPASAGVGRLSTQDQPVADADAPQTTNADACIMRPVPTCKPIEDGLPAFFPLPLHAALEMHRGVNSRFPRYFDDPRIFHESLMKQSAMAPATEGNDVAPWFADLKSQANRWAGALVGIRDAVGRLPTIPVWLWGTGAVVIAAARLRRLIAFRRRIARSLPVSPSISRLVAEVSRDIGLRRAPRIVMIDARISPMIWCGRMTTLVLPRFLWRELDDTGRRAILYHELAHVRRRDHIVTWIEWIVGAMYWWHPLVWWVRGRLREEAENCCDAWVTWLMPRGRRAYAEALLRTKQFADDSVPVKPAVGIGILTGRAKRFARRLTMVMTQKTTPTGSARSIALIACVTLVGWLATPALSLDEKPKPCDKKATAAAACSETSAQTSDKPCKHEDGKKCDEACLKTCTKVISKTSDKPLKVSGICVETPACASKATGVAGATYVTAPSAACSAPRVTVPAVRAVPAVPAIRATPALLMAMGDEDDDLAARMERLERHMEKLAQKLEQLNEYQPMPAVQPIAPLPPVPPIAPEQMENYQQALTDYQKLLPSLAAMQNSDIQEVVRTYMVPAGRLEALGELMIRSDVPVRVRVVDGGIEVHGPEWVQANFKAFVDVISADKEEPPVTYTLSKGKLDALQALMARSDVPVIVTPGETAIVVHGDAATQAVFRNFVNMIEGDAVRKTGDAKSTWFGDSYEWQAQVKKQQAKTRELAEEYKLQAEQAARKHARGAAGSSREARREAARNLERAIKELTRNTDRIDREIERLESEADRFEEKAAEIRKKADMLRAKAERAGNDEQTEALEERADSAEQQADEMEAQVEEIRDQVTDMEDQAESMEDEVEMLQDKLAQMEEEDDDGDV